MAEALPRFEDIIETYHDEIYRYVWRLLDGSRRSEGALEAHDLVQEVFLRAYRAYARLRPGSNVRAWLYKIATNCTYSAIRREYRGGGVELPLMDEHDARPDDADLPDVQFVIGQTLESIRQGIAELPPKQRAALVMRYVQELEYDEIASALGCSEDSARANVYQAIKRLRVALAEQV